MKWKYIFLVMVSFFFCACSGEDDNSTEVVPQNYMNLNVSGADISFETSSSPYQNGWALIRNGDEFSLFMSHGVGHSRNTYQMRFDKDGHFISFDVDNQDETYWGLNYSNYKNFPSHYFNFQLLSLDESTSRIKAMYSGQLYNNSILTAEHLDITGEFDVLYDLFEGTVGPHPNCSALFDNKVWKSTHWQGESPMNFSSWDPYKIEIFFEANNNATGNFNVTPNNTTNYIKLSKFNTATLTYDYYDVTGLLNYNYKEFHGAGRYSYLGTFQFTAVNPNNSNDIIIVTDGAFFSSQKY